MWTASVTTAAWTFPAFPPSDNQYCAFYLSMLRPITALRVRTASCDSARRTTVHPMTELKLS
jgi:hypothetical protein